MKIFFLLVLAALPFGCSTPAQASPPPIQSAAPARSVDRNNAGIESSGIYCDPHWHGYDKYLQGVIDSVQAQWDRQLEMSKAYPAAGKHVAVTFVLNSNGKIARIEKVEGDADDLGQKICMNALTAGAPYGKWTNDMIAVLGHKQKMTFKFYYAN